MALDLKLAAVMAELANAEAEIKRLDCDLRDCRNGSVLMQQEIKRLRREIVHRDDQKLAPCTEDTWFCTHGSLHKKDGTYICDLCGQALWTDPDGCEQCENAPTDPPEFKPFYDEEDV